MSQDEQDRLSLNPRWTPAFASSSSASNSAYYFTHTTQAAARVVFLYGLWPAAVAIWAHGGPGVLQAAKPQAARWRDGALVVEGFEPLPLARLAQEAHARGLVVGAAVHGFNRWQWTEADFDVVGGPVRFPQDRLSLRSGDGPAAAKQALARTPNRYHVLDRRTVFFPPTRNNNPILRSNTPLRPLPALSLAPTTVTLTLRPHP